MNEISRLIRAAGFALEGLVYLLREQKNTKLLLITAFLALVVLPLAGFSVFQTMIVFFSVMVAVVAETINTAIEITLDIITKGEYHSKVKIAKDVSACSVFFSLSCSTVLTLVFFVYNFLT